MRLLDVICAGDTLLAFLRSVFRGMMVRMKKKHLRGWKPPRLVCPVTKVYLAPVQLDMFEKNWFYHNGRFYVVSEKEDVEASQ